MVRKNGWDFNLDGFYLLAVGQQLAASSQQPLFCQQLAANSRASAASTHAK